MAELTCPCANHKSWQNRKFARGEGRIGENEVQASIVRPTLLILVMLTLAFNIQRACAVERIVGVRVSDWAKYDVDTSWTGIIDPRWELHSQTTWGSIEVTDVSGTVVTFTGVSHFKNGSELTLTGVKWDIAPTGSFGIILYFIGSNLQAGDSLFPSGTLRIDETVTRTYSGVSRENNHHISSGRGLAPGYDLYRLDCCWDQSTGILTEESLEMHMEDLSRSLSFHFKMVDTNLWVAKIPTTINELKTEIEELGSRDEIDNQGIVRSLIRKLHTAQKLVDKEKTDEATMVLEDFAAQVHQLSGIHITVEAANILVESAEYIMAYL